MNRSMQLLHETMSATNSQQWDCVCYGIGPIHSSQISQLQLSFLIQMLRRTDFATVALFDPLLDDSELQVIQSYGIDIIGHNEEAKRCIQRNTVFYMPHCEFNLYNNVVDANKDVLQDMIVIGNSFGMYGSIEMHRVREVAMPQLEGWMEVFNNTSIHSFI